MPILWILMLPLLFCTDNIVNVLCLPIVCTSCVPICLLWFVSSSFLCPFFTFSELILFSWSVGYSSSACCVMCLTLSWSIFFQFFPQIKSSSKWQSSSKVAGYCYFGFLVALIIILTKMSCWVSLFVLVVSIFKCSVSSKVVIFYGYSINILRTLFAVAFSWLEWWCNYLPVLGGFLCTVIVNESLFLNTSRTGVLLLWTFSIMMLRFSM